MKLAGVDPSIGRTSQCVLAIWDYDAPNEVAKLRTPLVGDGLDNLPAVVDWVAEKEVEHEFDYIGVDYIGLGIGAVGYLQTMAFAHKVHPFIASSRPSREWEKPIDIRHGQSCECTGCLMERTYSNWKTRVAHNLRRNAYQGKVLVPDHDLLKRDMQGYQLKKLSGRWKLEDPKVSPDFGDAALIGYAGLEDSEAFWMGA